MNLLIIRLLIFAVVFFAGLKLYRMYREWKLEQQDHGPSTQQGGKMVRCSWCNVHLPEQDALRAQGQWFCCGDHRDKSLAEHEDKDSDD
ncbi:MULTISPECIES: PP0621 family protein [Halomonas]|uniref:PP0621 family protein n=1 Tax=Halomonas TaxID=2745 RepID=UPI001C9612BA|nr:MULTISPECIES: PP0621 family protein [Halomonas]MBY5930327.1 HTTM domain-containing protein [Halomonas sp. DP8Y7-3]MBY6206629.1 HTTM domain-containing protein [Halomonas sp. DP3Y7-2]MBY6230160.1 HTTM domain-containing protein [Halomonas sp. DP3Y7-1]MCA0918290.1 HTTM domain-containing protein [Halomonas denitrificans]